MASPPLLHGFNPTLLLVLNLLGTFVFGLSGGMAGVRAQLDLFGAVVLAVVVGIAGGTIRDLLIGTPPATFRDWRYLAVAGGAGLVTSLAHPAINRLQRPIDVLDAAGLALFCVTGAATALAHRLGVVDSVILGAITGIGGGMLRDILVGEIPAVLRGGLYAIPALVGAGIVVVAYHAGDRTIVFPILGALACFLMRMAGLRYGIGLPRAADVALTRIPRLPGRPRAKR
ncbi:MAG: trimeric intracellular cation channel family protein [Solirubrobacterales bacterium]|nr:trimeric intracellular cation channel family protein [Solirubrobacterales bacterium]MBV9366411.1 trimeric intracellular cation channel family protein [Solirubrobacterales bacterium]MBV9681062.1 trimeric intracellular cation channel family protein [Solirubrobacterales bacterium]MBV9807252.1 trimeric intracellular cation channel family protein [Solirubrobacterales bacterium]